HEKSHPAWRRRDSKQSAIAQRQDARSGEIGAGGESGGWELVMKEHVVTQHHATQYHTVKRIDNSRLVRPAPKARLNDFWRRVAVGAAIGGCPPSRRWADSERIFRH